MPTILFVHGSGHAAWCWHEHFTGWFSAQGYTVVAPDLPHHGDLDHHGVLFTPLRSYVDAVAKTAAGLDRPLILVGHSLGGYIVQMYLEQAEADLAVLLASIPPAGAFALVRRLAARHPVMFLKTLVTGMLTDAPERTRELFFTPETPADVVDRCYQRLQPESLRVVMDVMTGLRPERVTTPVVVMGAEADTLVIPRAEVAATACAYHTTPRMLPGGHDMMLDTTWEQVATTITAAITDRLSV